MIERNTKDKTKCKDCGHSMRYHLQDMNGRINCQACERSGQTCDLEE